jgi:hypothetical protein
MTAATATRPITRDDLESKFRELSGDVDSAAESARNVGLIVGAIAVVAVVGLSFWLGRRRGRRPSTVVEIRRI